MDSTLANLYEERSTLRSRIEEQIILKQITEDHETAQGHIPFNEREPFNPHGPLDFRKIPHLEDITTESSVEPDEQLLTITPPPVKLEVGIIGAGMAGLYTAMILKSLNIGYELLEASGRAGGRVYTHRFTEQEGDYYDVGAMRFPNIPIMRRTFDLFKRLGINDDLSEKPAQGTLIPYFLTGPRTPLLYNNIRHTPPPDEEPADIFRDGQRYGGMVPDKFVMLGPNAVTKPIYEEWRKKLSNSNQVEWQLAWRQLMTLDARGASVRSELFTHLRGDPTNAQYTDTDLNHVISWCERAGSTGSYNGSFVNSVIHSLEFDWPAFPDLTSDPIPESVSAGENLWRCVNGGSHIITQKMKAKIGETKILYNHTVTRIAHNKDSDTMIVEAESKESVNVVKGYTHVITTPTLGCLQAIDTRDAGLDNSHREAFRTLGYAQAVKVGIKFKRRWWADDEGLKINQGGQGKTDRPTRVVVYPSYALHTEPGTPGVLLACYNSVDDAARLGGPMHNNSAITQKLVYSQVIADLAAMHGVGEQELRSLTESYHAYNWYGDALTRGAWGAFGPGYYSSLFGRLQRPQARGHLFFAGEATSIYPGWIVGSLNSAYRSVRQMLVAELYKVLRSHDKDKIPKIIYLLRLIRNLWLQWGTNKYEPGAPRTPFIEGTERWQVFLGIIGQEAGL